MDIAITGASGFIGSALVEHLTAQGHRVLRVVRPRSATAPTGTDAIRWDPDAGTIDAAGLEGIDAVVHLAGAGIGDRRWTPERKRLILESRTRGTGLIASTLAGLQRPPRTLLSGSAIGYYGDTGERAVDETAPPGDDFVARVVTAWEAAATPAAEAGIRTVLLRSGLVLSAKGGVLARQLPFFRWGLGGRIGTGRQRMSWISLDDELGAIGWLLDQDLAGPVNLTSPDVVTNAEFTKSLGRAVRRPTTVTPLFAPRVLYGRELVDTLLLTSQHVVPAVLETAGYPFRHRSLDAAWADLLT